MTDTPKPLLPAPPVAAPAAPDGLATLRLGLDQAVRQARLARRCIADAEVLRAQRAAEGVLRRLYRRVTGR